MRSKINKEGDLVFKESGLTTRVWALLILPFAVAALLFIAYDEKTTSKTIPVILLGFFIVISLLILLIVKYELTYVFSNRRDEGTFIIPVAMGISKKVEKFRISDIKEIYILQGNDYSEAVGRAYVSEGFELRLKDGKTVNGNYRSSDFREISAITTKISEYIKPDTQ